MTFFASLYGVQPMNNSIQQLAVEIGEVLLHREWKLATTESCSAGGVAYAITTVPGSSAWFERGFVTYSNLSKEELLGVRHATLMQHGAVSEETAREMAIGALEHSQAQVSVAITGIAGPDGGSVEKPVGTVWLAWASVNKDPFVKKCLFTGDRESVRIQSIQTALEELLRYLKL